jgi:hypothetical protein
VLAKDFVSLTGVILTVPVISTPGVLLPIYAWDVGNTPLERGTAPLDKSYPVKRRGRPVQSIVGKNHSLTPDPRQDKRPRINTVLGRKFEQPSPRSLLANSMPMLAIDRVFKIAHYSKCFHSPRSDSITVAKSRHCLWNHYAHPMKEDPMTLTSKIFFVCKDFSWRLCGDPG